MIKISAKTASPAKIAFYLERADECSHAAASATLQNVRDRCLRSEAAWRDMAGVLRDAEAEAASSEPPSAAITPSTPAFANFA